MCLISLLFVALPIAGWTLHAPTPTGEMSSANSRLLRSEENAVELHVDAFSPLAREGKMQIELDSTGKGRTDTPASLLNRLGEPHLENGGFDAATAPDDFMWATRVPGWTVFGAEGDESKVAIIASGSHTFGGVKSVDGSTFIGLRTRGNGISQQVDAHTKENWYTLLWHASCHSPSGASQAKLRVSVGATVKFDEDVNCGAMKWYKVSYQAFGDYGQEMIRFEIPSGEPSQDVAVLLDKIVVEPEHVWDYKTRGPITFGSSAGGAMGGVVVSGGQVLIQKVECSGPASKQTCKRSKFLTCGGFDEDGATSIIETAAAGDCSVFTAGQTSVRSVKWQFRCNCINEASSAGDNTESGGSADDAWWLHSGYGPNKCQAKNGDNNVDKSFDVRDNLLGSLQLTTTGTSCGALFAIMKHTGGDA